MFRITRIRRFADITNFEQKIASSQTDEEAALLLGWRFEPFTAVHDPQLRNNRIGGLMTALEIMKENNCEIGIATYRVALYISRTSGKLWAAEKILSEIKRRKIVPDAALKSAILDCLCRLEKRPHATDRLLSYFNTMESPTSHDYRNVIFAVSRLRNPTLGHIIYKQCFNKLEPSKKVYEAAILSCLNYKMCQGVLSDMQLYGVSPDQYTIHGILQVCARSKDVVNGEKVFQSASDSNFASSKVNSYMLAVYRHARCWDKYDSFYEKVIKPDSEITEPPLTSHMRVLAERGDTSAAMKLFGRLLQQRMITVQGWCEISIVIKTLSDPQLGIDVARVYLHLKIPKIDNFEAAVYQVTGLRLSQIPVGLLPNWFLNIPHVAEKQSGDYLPPCWAAVLDQAVRERKTRLELQHPSS